MLERVKEKYLKDNGNKSLLMNHEQRIQAVQGFTLLSDVFMSVVLEDIPSVQYVLRILTGNGKLIIKNVKTQYVLSKEAARGARLDVLAEDTDGILYSIEIQRSKTVRHDKRIRFYGALIDGDILKKGMEYSELPDLYIIYISEKDILGDGQTVYSVEKICTETGKPYDDGLHLVYVNAEVDDHSEIAELMRYFKTSEPDDMSQGELSKRVHFLKSDEGG